MDATSLARFRKLCGMLGSEHDGERAAAALKATELLKQSGTSWGEVGIGKVPVASPGPSSSALHAALSRTISEKDAIIAGLRLDIASERMDHAAVGERLIEVQRQLEVAQRALEQKDREKQTPVGWALTKLVDLAAFVFTVWIVALVWKAMTS